MITGREIGRSCCLKGVHKCRVFQDHTAPYLSFLLESGNVAVKPRVVRCGMRPPYALVLEFIDLLKSYGGAEMTAMVDAGSQFAKPLIAVRWRFFEYFDPGSSRFLWASNSCRLVMPKASSYQILIEFNGRSP